MLSQAGMLLHGLAQDKPDSGVRSWLRASDRSAGVNTQYIILYSRDLSKRSSGLFFAESRKDGDDSMKIDSQTENAVE